MLEIVGSFTCLCLTGSNLTAGIKYDKTQLADDVL